MSKLTTHILDTSAGTPAASVTIRLYRLQDQVAGSTRTRSEINSLVTNSDGRADAPLLEGAAFQPGEYELEFHIGDYFEKKGAQLPHPKFIDIVIIRFGIADKTAHYHVPLLVSPFGYSTYRGS